MAKHLTVAQATVAFLSQQYVERDGEEVRYFGGCLGIFGHGNVAGLGQALEQDASLRYYLFRNEQAMVHAASAFAKTTFRRRAMVCTTSIGPGATNMITGAALATINRLPVLLLPGDIFASRHAAPVLQQLESSHTPDISVNDCFKPISRYWDRIQRPEQLLTSLPEAMRVLTSPAQTGAVTVCMPQDLQAEAFDFPEEFFHKRVWHIPRSRCDAGTLKQAAEWIRSSRQPMIIAGGGVLYSEASAALAAFCASTGIPVGETQSGKGSLPFDHAQQAGAVGATGTSAANMLAREADLIIGVGTRYSDFTTASKTAFQNQSVRFVNINVCEFDANKHAAVALAGDARVTLDELRRAVGGHRIDAKYSARIAGLQQDWNREVERLYGIVRKPMAQSQFIRVLNEFTQPADIIVNAAGSLPGDLHKLWRTRQPGGYHMDYGYSCMGYEIAGGLGIKMAHPDREVYVLVGDGSYLMMAQEIVTSVQEGYKLNIVLLDNHGFASIGGLSRSCGNEGMGTEYRYRRDGNYSGEPLPVDFEANAASLGAWTTRVNRIEDLNAALQSAREQPRTSVIVIETSYDERVPGYESWWDVPVAEVSESTSVQSAREAYEAARKKQRYFF